MGEDKLDEMINLLNITSDDTIVDIGGGNGEVLLKMIEKSNANGILIDTHKGLIETCREKSKSLVESGKLLLVCQDAKEYLKTMELESIDCIVCMASSHVFDDYVNFIKEVKPYLKPDGFLLIGEGFWLKKPSEEYLKILGGTESELMYHHENMEVPETLGLTYLYAHIASQDDWNKFEGIFFLEEELKALKMPEDKKKEHLKSMRSFRKVQYKLGRATMGFGLYLFKK